MTEEQIKQKAKRFCNRYNFSYTILSYNQTKRKSGALIAEESYIAGYHECEKDTIHTDNKETLNNALKRIEELEQENERIKTKYYELQETLKKVRLALTQERTANIMNYGKGGVEMFNDYLEILKGVSN